MLGHPGAIAILTPTEWTFSINSSIWVVIHKTAGFMNARDCALYFQRGSDGNHVSAHYVVGLDGQIVQCVDELRGAGANCCCAGNYASFLPGPGSNLNTMTISVEHIDPTDDNSTNVPAAQMAASIALIRGICERHNIPKRLGDSKGGIIRHADIDPINRSRCPGNYNMNELIGGINNGGYGNQPPVAAPKKGFPMRVPLDTLPQYFTKTGATSYYCKQTRCTIRDGMLAFYETLSLDGITLPIIGLPKSSERLVSVGVVMQDCERATLVYNPSHTYDKPPGCGDVYLKKL